MSGIFCFVERFKLSEDTEESFGGTGFRQGEPMI